VTPGRDDPDARGAGGPVPGGPVAPLVERFLVRPKLERIFDYRTERLPELLAPG
jgi:hypothetical protein